MALLLGWTPTILQGFLSPQEAPVPGTKGPDQPCGQAGATLCSPVLQLSPRAGGHPPHSALCLLTTGLGTIHPGVGNPSG